MWCNFITIYVKMWNSHYMLCYSNHEAHLGYYTNNVSVFVYSGFLQVFCFIIYFVIQTTMLILAIILTMFQSLYFLAFLMSLVFLYGLLLKAQSLYWLLYLQCFSCCTLQPSSVVLFLNNLFWFFELNSWYNTWL